jgi:3-isopropylmalate/(R)-2-methylmalate dehydratase small subunit
MSALTTLTGPAAPLLEADVNTDTIAPLYRENGGAAKSGVRTQAELAGNLFAGRRYNADGSERPDFILNQPLFRNARFLIAGPNFACGSSRETAATMLNAFGIRCVIAPSFAPIFYDNCFRNHMIPIVVDWERVQQLGRDAASGTPFTLDVERGTLVSPNAAIITFTIPTFRRDLLLTGADEVAVTLRRAGEIAAYVSAITRTRPWELHRSHRS